MEILCIAILILLFVVYKFMALWREVSLVFLMLDYLTTSFLGGMISAEEYTHKRRRVIENMTWLQSKLFYIRR